MTTPEIRYYNNNKNLKAEGVQLPFTEFQVQEIRKCARDPIYFIKNYVKIVDLDFGLVPFDLWPYQEQLVKLCQVNRFVIAKMARQIGKSTTIVALLLWHFCFEEFYRIAILANKGDNAKKLLEKLKLAFEHLPLWLKPGVVEWNKKSIKADNGNEIVADSTSGNAGRSGSFNFILLDEFAFVEPGIQDDFFTSVFPTISSGKTTKLVIISTPKGMEKFYKLWKAAIEGKSSFIPFEVHWSDHPRRDEKWKQEQLEIFTEEEFRQEYECEFLGSSNTLIRAEALRTLSYEEPIEQYEKFRIFEHPEEGGIYFIISDVSEGLDQDFSTAIVIRVQEEKFSVVATYRDNKITPEELPAKLVYLGNMYNEADILIEVNSVGKQVADILWDDFGYPNILKTETKGKKGQHISLGFGKDSGKKVKFGVKTTTQTKNIGCMTLKSLVEKNRLEIRDEQIHDELLTFIQSGKSYRAQTPHHDDMVMPLVLFGWLTTQDYFDNVSDPILWKKKRAIEENARSKRLNSPAVFTQSPEPKNERLVSMGGIVWELVE